MANLSKGVSVFVALCISSVLSIIILLVSECQEHRQMRADDGNMGISAPHENRIIYERNGRIIKYLDSDWNVVYFKSKASYYRSAFYRNGIPDPDSLVIVYYITGEKKSEAHLLKERPDIVDGVMRSFYKSGMLESEVVYSDGILDGTYEAFFENGNKRSLAQYKDGSQEGEYFHYFLNGNLSEHGSYRKGLKSGQFESYYSNGKIKSQGKYKEGKQYGVWSFYDEKGLLTIKYFDDTELSQFESRDESTGAVPSRDMGKQKRSLSPDDAYDEGYDEGYNQGYEDGREGESYEHGYDDSSRFYNYYETRYKEGYNCGYEEGYSRGRAKYNEEEGDGE